MKRGLAKQGMMVNDEPSVLVLLRISGQVKWLITVLSC